MNAPDKSSPLAERFRTEATRARSELDSARGLGPTTYAALADLGQATIDDLSRAGIAADACSGLADRVRLLRSTARLLADAGAGEVPPMNDQVYAAALSLHETASLARHASGAGAKWTAALESWLRADSAGEPTAAGLGLALAFGMLCRRAGLRATPAGAHAAVDLEIDGWPVRCACAVAGGEGWVARLAETVRSNARPAMVVLEAGPIVPAMSRAPAVASDADAGGVAAGRVDAVLAAGQEKWAEAIGDELAFAAVARATLPVVNAASGRVLLVETFRCVNLCALDDPRAAKLRRFNDMLVRAAG